MSVHPEAGMQGAAGCPSAQVYVALGSNLGDRPAHIRHAVLALLDQVSEGEVTCSPLYETVPMGPADQPDYLNAVARFHTRVTPRELLRVTQSIESARGRTRDGVRWGARVLDIDILLYDDLCMDVAGLTLPHPGIASRSFVLYPLSDLAPDLVIPGSGTRSVKDLAAAAGQFEIRRLDSRDELSIHRR